MWNNHNQKNYYGKLDFRGDAVDKNPPVSAGDMGLIPGQGRFYMPQKN